MKLKVEDYVKATCVDNPFHGRPAKFLRTTSEFLRENTVFPKEFVTIGQIADFLSNSPVINQIWERGDEENGPIRQYWRIFSSNEVGCAELAEIASKGCCDKGERAINVPEDLEKQKKEEMGSKIGNIDFWPEEQPLSRDSKIPVVYIYDHWESEGVYFRKMLKSSTLFRFSGKGYFNEKMSFELLKDISKGVLGDNDIFVASCPEGEELCEFGIEEVSEPQIMFLSKREEKIRSELGVCRREEEKVKKKMEENNNKIWKIVFAAKKLGINIS